MIDINSPTFWLVGAVWFTVPILSWLWSMASIYYYRKLIKLMADATKALEQVKSLNEQMVSYRLESMEIRSKAEEEIKLACSYYAKMTDLILAKRPLKNEDS